MIEKKYQAGNVEQRIYQSWIDAGAFKAGAGAKQGAPGYSIVIPPPNVTGSLHIGHALNNTLQDILIRFERMRGKDVLWQPGLDHAGIATQMIVERQLMERQEPSRREMRREKFLEKVWEWKNESGGAILNQLRRLGASCDWSRERFTLGDHGGADEQMVRAVTKVFVDLYNKGLIYRAKRLVNWHPGLQTAVSDLEVENLEVKGQMWHLRYPLAEGATYEHPFMEAPGEDGETTRRDWMPEDGKPDGIETRSYIVVATTRPEPEARGNSCWHTTPSSTMDKVARTWPCWLGGKGSMMRLMAWTQLLVCNVAKTKWPVSEMTRAASMVSRSRISPMSTTSGSCRKTYLSAVENFEVSAPISRWLTIPSLWGWRYSIGSSIVMI